MCFCVAEGIAGGGFADHNIVGLTVPPRPIVSCYSVFVCSGELRWVFADHNIVGLTVVWLGDLRAG